MLQSGGHAGLAAATDMFSRAGAEQEWKQVDPPVSISTPISKPPLEGAASLLGEGHHPQLLFLAHPHTHTLTEHVPQVIPVPPS